MNGYILTEAKLIDDRRISFSFFDEDGKREIVCQTAGDDNAPAMLEKLKKWKRVSIDDYDWIMDDSGRPTTLRVYSIRKIKNNEPAKLHS
jgi:hypothetical protein